MDFVTNAAELRDKYYAKAYSEVEEQPEESITATPGTDAHALIQDFQKKIENELDNLLFELNARGEDELYDEIAEATEGGYTLVTLAKRLLG